MTRVLIFLFFLLGTFTTFAGPEEPPFYYFRVGIFEHPIGFTVFQDRSYLHLGFDDIWVNVHWSVPTVFIVALVAVLVTFVVRRIKNPNKPVEATA